jgi:hypothetical protein
VVIETVVRAATADRVAVGNALATATVLATTVLVVATARRATARRATVRPALGMHPARIVRVKTVPRRTVRRQRLLPAVMPGVRACPKPSARKLASVVDASARKPGNARAATSKTPQSRIAKGRAARCAPVAFCGVLAEAARGQSTRRPMARARAGGGALVRLPTSPSSWLTVPAMSRSRLPWRPARLDPGPRCRGAAWPTLPSCP